MNKQFKKKAWCLMLFVIVCVCFNTAMLLAGDLPGGPVHLDFFFSPGCTECEEVKKIAFPEIEDQFEELYELTSHDLSHAETIPLLVAYQQRCNNDENGRVALVVDHSIFLSGGNTIITGVVDQINNALIRHQKPGWQLPEAPVLSGEQAMNVVRERASALTFSVVALGGLLDGFNPCAISTLIFFMSVLAISKANRRTRLWVGVSFITASFIVYMAIGMGIIYAFRQVPQFGMVKKGIEVVLGLCMLPLGLYSFRDAFRFRRTQRPDDVKLQIPKKIKRRIHAFMNSRLGVGGPILGGLITGAGVTVLESVCTGQSYVPVLMYMLKRDCSDVCAWVLLVIYNLLFVLPLTIVFVCFHRGLQLTALIDWSKRNLVVVKILLGLFFLTMALLLLWPGRG